MKPTIFPALRYKDAPAALEWLCRAFLFEKQAVFPAADGTIVHAELRRDGGVVGINSATPPVENNPWSSVLQGVYVTIDDVDAHHACAQSAGARIAITIGTAWRGDRPLLAVPVGDDRNGRRRIGRRIRDQKTLAVWRNVPAWRPLSNGNLKPWWERKQLALRSLELEAGVRRVSADHPQKTVLLEKQFARVPPPVRLCSALANLPLTWLRSGQ